MVCGMALKKGLLESSRLERPIFTPSTKAEEGHDLNISLEEVEGLSALIWPGKSRDVSLAIYEKASQIAEEQGIIVADTKFEFGLMKGEVIIIDEALTPDSSRFWSKQDIAGISPGQLRQTDRKGLPEYP